MNPWLLPETAVIGGIEYEINSDYRDILEIIRHLDDPDEPDLVRWHTAIALFYEGEIPHEHEREAMEYLSAFISYGEKDADASAVRVMDWEQDAKAIVADVNKVAGQEIRRLPYLHWWTFLSYFNALGEGHFLTLVAIRNKLRKGKPLEKWEKEFYREHHDQVVLKKKYSAEELAEQERLKQLLGE